MASSEDARPRKGARHAYGARQALGARNAENQHPDMVQLDLSPGTDVKVIGHDDERDLVLIEWTDQLGNPRITSIEPAEFSKSFAPASRKG